MPESACVHLVDDDEAIRRSLTYAIVSAGLACRAYARADELIAAGARLAPGCIVTDVRMPGLDGVSLLRHLRALGVSHPVVVMSGFADVSLAVQAMKAGACDFLQKPFRSAQLIEVVREAVAHAPGAPPLPDEHALRYRRALQGLSPRQREVLAGIVAGKLNKTIAHELGLSVRTVESYRAEIMAKTQVRNATELVRLAVLAGL